MSWWWVQLVWFSLLGLWMNFGGQFPWTFLVLPHFGEESCQLLLSRTDNFGWFTVFKFQPSRPKPVYNRRTVRTMPTGPLKGWQHPQKPFWGAYWGTFHFLYNNDHNRRTVRAMPTGVLLSFCITVKKPELHKLPKKGAEWKPKMKLEYLAFHVESNKV